MNAQETARILAVLAAAFPRFDPTDDTVAVWSAALADMTYEQTDRAVRRLILTCVFPPSIAEVREAARVIHEDTLPTTGEAWSLALRAMRDCPGNWEHNEDLALADLPPIVAQAVRNMGWREMNHSEKADVIRGQFARVYEQLVERHRRESVLPPQLRSGAAAGGLISVGETLKQIEGGIDG